MTIPPVERIRLQKAAVDEGFGIDLPDDNGWLAFQGLGTPGSIRLTFVEPLYLAATDHGGVASELRTSWQTVLPAGLPTAPSGFTAFAAATTSALHRLVRDMRRLARSLPREPLRLFEEKTASLPRTTEAERLVVQRVGQKVFREALMDYWAGQCAVTGVTESRLLRASHIKPWARCESDAERLDVHNGLLLAAHLDAAFDAGLVSFADDGAIVFSIMFSQTDRTILGLHPGMALTKMSNGHRDRLAWHRQYLLQPALAAAPTTA